ncbi:MAG: hypothetical protein FD171_1070 [Actinobacteria bacterium]|nr:MAG: hypothetical protein FD171_1070 [Actinomycetota bacterium]
MMVNGRHGHRALAALVAILIAPGLAGCATPRATVAASPTAAEAPIEVLGGWQTYTDYDKDSGVAEYEIGEDYINIRFDDGSVYTYTYASAGATDIERMKELASAGNGLNAFIMTNVEYDYESKSPSINAQENPESRSCASCDGQGSTSCVACRGRGRTACISCRSTGFIRCTMCGGSGRDECWQCPGGGQSTSGITCTMCGGSGAIDCIGCTGGGYDCYSCGGTGASVCSLCVQSGVQECLVCNGSGSVSN